MRSAKAAKHFGSASNGHARNRPGSDIPNCAPGLRITPRSHNFSLRSSSSSKVAPGRSAPRRSITRKSALDASMYRTPARESSAVNAVYVRRIAPFRSSRHESTNAVSFRISLTSFCTGAGIMLNADSKSSQTRTEGLL
eukprot:5786157-Prymnesium_polylepis.1